MSHDWKIGDWAAGGISGKRWLIISCELNGMNLWAVSNVDGFHPAAVDRNNLTHLPDCTGWNWQPPKPIEPPPGYRLMGNDEIVKDGDKYLSGEDWYYANVHGDTVEKLKHSSTLAYARKIEPQYRPFANAAEFKPFRDKWWKYKQDKEDRLVLIRNPVCYSDHAHYGRTWQSRFNECEFEDGTPFGIATT